MYYYTVSYDNLSEGVKREVSQVADGAYSPEGVALYDQIIVTERDIPTVYLMIGDALSAVVARCRDICVYSPTAGPSPEMRLAFYVPDFDEESNGDAVEDELTRFIVTFVTAEFLTKRHPASVPEYDAMAKAALAKAVTLLKTRKAPLEQWT